MNQRSRLTLIALGLNLLAGAILATPLFFFGPGDTAIWWAVGLILLALVSLLIQLVVGIVYAMDQQKKVLGQSMLLAVGIILLIGFSVCGSMIMGVV